MVVECIVQYTHSTVTGYDGCHTAVVVLLANPSVISVVAT